MNRRERKAILAVLKNGETEACLEAIKTIQQQGGKHTNRLLLRAIRSQNPDVRAATIRAFAKPTNFTILGRLLFHIKHDGLAIQQEAVDALGRLGSPYTVSRLIQVLGDPTRQVRMNVARALGQIGDERAIPALIEALQDENQTVVDWAAEALGNFGQAAISPLITVLMTGNYVVNEQATAMRRKWAEHSNHPLLATDAYYDRNASARRLAASALTMIGEAALPNCINLLQNPDRAIQRFALQAIAEMALPAAIPALQTMLNDSDYHFRCEAVSGLGRIDDPAIVPMLLNMMSDPVCPVRERLADVLSRHAQLGDSRAVDALFQMLHDKDADVRSQAIERLAKISDPRVMPAMAECLNDEAEGDHYQRTVSETTLYALEHLDNDEARAVIATWRNATGQADT